MAEKGFGVKEINLIGASGTPTIESPNNLNLNAVNVAISTNVSIGGTLSVTGNVSVGGTLTYEDVTNIDSVGLITARSGVVVGAGKSILVGAGVTISSSTKGDIQISGIATANSFDAKGGSVNVDIGSLNQGFYLNNGNSTWLGLSWSSSASRYSFNGNSGGNYPLVVDDFSTISFNPSSGACNLNYAGSGKLETTSTGINVTGAITVNGSALSITPTATDIQVAYELINTSSSGNGWRINGNGIVNTTGNPDLFLIRGQKYRFINNSGGSHPFRIQSDSSTSYDTGVTNNNSNSGNIDFVPRNDAPARLYYNCTNHGGMLGNIYLRGAGGNETNVGITTFSGAVRQTGNPVFMAYRVSNYSLTTTETELVYDSEKIDVGGNYNPSNGRFTAPVDGLYEFGYASIAKNTNTVYRYTLKVNGNDPFSPLRMELRLHQAASEYATNGEFVVYVNMTAGQHASVYAKADINVSAVYGSSNYGYTYFRGRLIG